MAIEKLPVDFADAVTSQQMYKVTNAGAGQVLIEDVSTYSVAGSYFGSKEINTQRQTVNDVITLAEKSDSDLAKIKNGTTPISHVTSAGSVSSATTATQANTAGSVVNDFVIPEQTLVFTNKICEITNPAITADSLADVVFSRDTLDVATKSVIEVETSAGAVTLTAGRTPSSDIKATIHIRVV